jgi:hypothetical protein
MLSKQTYTKFNPAKYPCGAVFALKLALDQQLSFRFDPKPHFFDRPVISDHITYVSKNNIKTLAK